MDTTNINQETRQSNEQIEPRSDNRFGDKNTLSRNQNEQGTYRVEEENIEGRNIKRVRITDNKINNEIKNYDKNKPTFIAKITPDNFLKLTANDKTTNQFRKGLKKANNQYLDIEKLNSSGKQNNKYHGLGELVKQLPKALENPLNIVESKNNSIVAITELSDSNGDIVIASIKMNGKGQVEIDNISKNISANVLTSAYGRENYDYQKKPHNGDYTGWMEENKKNDKIVYDIDEGIKKQRVNGQWLSLPNSNNSLTNNNIPQNDQKVNSDISTNSNMQNNEKNVQKAVKKAIAPLNKEIKALKKEVANLKQDNTNEYAGRFADGTEQQLQQAKKNLEFNIKRLSKTVDSQEYGNKIAPTTFDERLVINKEQLNAVKEQYKELKNEYTKRGLKTDSFINEQLENFDKQERLYDDIETDDVIQARLIDDNVSEKSSKSNKQKTKQ